MKHYCDNCNDKDMEIIDLKKEYEVQIRKLSKFETERIIKLKKEHEKEIKWWENEEKIWNKEELKLKKEIDELKKKSKLGLKLKFDADDFPDVEDSKQQLKKFKAHECIFCIDKM